MSAGTFRVAAVGDLHCRKTSGGAIAPLLAGVHADVLLLCGDLTDYGLPEEAHVLARELSVVRIPMVAVLGNHDYESRKEEEVVEILAQAGVRVLDGDAVEIGSLGIAGVKGFAGGFGRGTLGPWGEAGVKRFVQEALDEALKLEAALSRMRMSQRVALMHYSPVRATVEGEPPEIFPFLGCGRLEEPLHRYPPSVVFHGHAHNGSPCGTTADGVPVYNVALPLLRRTLDERTPVRVVTLAEESAPASLSIPPDPAKVRDAGGHDPGLSPH
jgi:Icc-related predicted phosphoesterase